MGKKLKFAIILPEVYHFHSPPSIFPTHSLAVLTDNFYFCCHVYILERKSRLNFVLFDQDFDMLVYAKAGNVNL